MPVDKLASTSSPIWRFLFRYATYWRCNKRFTAVVPGAITNGYLRLNFCESDQVVNLYLNHKPNCYVTKVAFPDDTVAGHLVACLFTE